MANIQVDYQGKSYEVALRGVTESEFRRCFEKLTFNEDKQVFKLNEDTVGYAFRIEKSDKENSGETSIDNQAEIDKLPKGTMKFRKQCPCGCNGVIDHRGYASIKHPLQYKLVFDNLPFDIVPIEPPLQTPEEFLKSAMVGLYTLVEGRPVELSVKGYKRLPLKAKLEWQVQEKWPTVNGMFIAYQNTKIPFSFDLRYPDLVAGCTFVVKDMCFTF